MEKNMIQKKRYEKNMPLALLAKEAGISIMELWRIETSSDYTVPEEILAKISAVLLPSEEQRSARGA